MRKIIYCTLDTETVGGAAHPTGMYNLGCTIHDKDGNIFATTSMLIMEHYEEIAKDEYAKKNFHIYAERLARGEITAIATEVEAVEVVRNLCKFYGVKYVMAFNTGFDYVKTSCKSLLDDFEFIDIYLMALQTITTLKSYRKFCIDNNFYSRSGKTCSTTAQTIYAFMTNNADYTEEHTALSDALIETAIYARCYGMHKKFTKNVHQHNYKGYKCFPQIA